MTEAKASPPGPTRLAANLVRVSVDRAERHSNTVVQMEPVPQAMSPPARNAYSDRGGYFSAPRFNAGERFRRPGSMSRWNLRRRQEIGVWVQPESSQYGARGRVDRGQQVCAHTGDPDHVFTENWIEGARRDGDCLARFVRRWINADERPGIVGNDPDAVAGWRRSRPLVLLVRW